VSVLDGREAIDHNQLRDDGAMPAGDQAIIFAKSGQSKAAISGDHTTGH